jgi:amidase
MVVLGKSVTTEFGHRTAGKTRNPRDLGYTPGGSSSGSAAAVADGMVPLGLGTQTGGSVIRPAAYCGIVGYKPTFGTIDRAGIMTLCETFDTVGVLARSVEDAACFASVLAGREWSSDAPVAARGVIVGLCRTPIWDEATPDCQAAVEGVAARLAWAGADIRDVTMPRIFDGLGAAYRVIANYEGRRALAREARDHPEQLSRALRSMLTESAGIGDDDYSSALRAIADLQRLFDGAFHRCDVVITPSAPGTAPAGLADIGSAKFNNAWSAVGAPCITLPIARRPSELPLGVQVIGRRFDDAKLLAVAAWMEGALLQSH